VGVIAEPHTIEAGKPALTIGAGKAAKHHVPRRQGCEASGKHVLHGVEPADQVELLEDQRHLWKVFRDSAPPE
jgi:hypothetical protein